MRIQVCEVLTASLLDFVTELDVRLPRSGVSVMDMR